jgi:ABC-2 type transport system ATP-binding protein
LCDYIGVIVRGRLVAQGPLAELRSGAPTGQTLEELFLDLIGADRAQGRRLDWLAG